MLIALVSRLKEENRVLLAACKRMKHYGDNPASGLLESDMNMLRRAIAKAEEPFTGAVLED